MMASHLYERWELIRFWGILVTLYLGTSGAVWCRWKFSLDYGEKQTCANVCYQLPSEAALCRDWGRKCFCFLAIQAQLTSSFPFLRHSECYS